MDKNYKMAKVAHPDMIETDITIYSIYNDYIQQIMETYHVGKELASKLFLNALRFNTVSNEVFGQIAFILNDKTSDEEG